MKRLFKMMIPTLAVLGLLYTAGCTPNVSSADAIAAHPRIDPDYTSLVIPPNIAPLNFRILEPGEDYLVRLSADAGPSRDLHCPTGTFQVGIGPWHDLLSRNKGRNIYYDIFVKKDGTWRKFQRIANTVAEEPIDSHIVYRRLAPNKQLSEIRGIFQRDLESFSCSAIVTPQEGTVECFNCHTFWQNNSKQFLIHQRGVNPGMVLVTDAKPRKINTQAPPPMWRHLAFASWHPDGIHIAATINQYIDHESSTERLSYFETVEKRGDLVVYNVEKNTLSTTPAVFGPEYIETHPCWFPDGKFICFSRGKDRTIFSSKDFNEFRHDLMRISFDVTTETWGSPETLMAYSRRGKSCAFPRPSPCGKFVLLVLSNKTTYPIHQESSDLYLFDMKTKETRPLDAVNSPLAESFPCWSSNGRWFSFVSTRRDGICALPYFAYFDKNGQAHKAFLLPEKDPVRWDTYTDTYNVVELVKSRVTIDPFDLISVMNRPGKPALFPNPPRPGTSGY